MLWIAMLASVLIYGLLAWIITSESAEPADWRDPMVYILAGMAAMVMIAAIVVPGLVVTAARRAKRSDRPSTSQPTSAFELTGEVTTAYILRLTMIESVAIFGLVLAMVKQSFDFFVPFGLVAIAAFLAISPSTDHLRGLDRSGR